MAEGSADQKLFADRLDELANGLEAIKAGHYDLEEIGNLLRGWFGKGVVSRVIARKNEEMGSAVRDGRQSYGRSGLFVPAAPALVTAAPAAASARPSGSSHTFMGGQKW